MVTTADRHASHRSLLQQVTGTQWIGVTFLERPPTSHCGVHPGAIRFCEAISRAHTGCIELVPEMLCCQGAGHVFGWTANGEAALPRKLADRTGVSEEQARDLVGQVPVLRPPCAGICVGDSSYPDVWVTYAQPEAVMRVVRLWETAVGTSLTVTVSGFMAVCGNAVVRAHTSQSISLSFGCPDSRQYGGIRSEELVVAIPAGLLAALGERSPGDSL